MPKTANIFTRVDPVIKEQAEAVLEQLGLSMSTAMGLFLQQVVAQRGIPFEVKLAKAEPVAYGALTDAEFDSMMSDAVSAYASGKGTSFEDFDKSIRQELGL